MNKNLLLLPLFFLSMNAIAVPITSLQLTGGSFSMAQHTDNPLIPGAFADMSVDGINYDGSRPPSCSSVAGPVCPRAEDMLPVSIAAFEFSFFGAVSVYTTPYDDYGSGPHSAVSGDLTGNVLSLDLSSWSWGWADDITVNQGAASVFATTDVDGNFTATWSAVFNGSPFDGQVGHWVITGQVTAIRLPTGLLLFSSGLLGFIGITHKKAA